MDEVAAVVRMTSFKKVVSHCAGSASRSNRSTNFALELYDVFEQRVLNNHVSDINKLSVYFRQASSSQVFFCCY